MQLLVASICISRSVGTAEDFSRYVRPLKLANGTFNMSYSSLSAHNYNSGARYYMRYSTWKTSLRTFGYSYIFQPFGQYFFSGYGYHLVNPPTYYSPIYLNATHIYYPPMFIYYHWSIKSLWNVKQPRHVCRNDNAFWLLENQTSEFVDELLPTLDLHKFDDVLPDPADDYWNYQGVLTSPSQVGENFVAVNSMKVKSPFDPTATGKEGITPVKKPRTTTATPAPIDRRYGISYTLRKVLAYNFFACPDGKDPAETFCCGPRTAQFCCADPNYYRELTTVQSQSIPPVVVMSVLVLSFIASVLNVLVCTIKRFYCTKFENRSTESPASASASATPSAPNQPTGSRTVQTADSAQVGSLPPATRPYPTNGNNDDFARGMPPSYSTLGIGSSVTVSPTPRTVTDPAHTTSSVTSPGVASSAEGTTTSLPVATASGTSMMSDSPYISASSYLAAAINNGQSFSNSHTPSGV